MNPANEDMAADRHEIAGAWCVRLASQTLAPEDRAEFESWLQQDPANSAAYDKALSVWHGLHAIGGAPEIISGRADALDALRRANRRRWSRSLGTRWAWALAAAASLLLALMSSLYLMQDGMQEFTTAVGERRAVMLEDGSRLSLDADTRVAIDYDRERRELRLLSGRAKFEVAREASRPFTVTAGGRTIVATGTVFSVELLGNRLHVIVYEGRVAVVRGSAEAPTALREMRAADTAMATALEPGRELVADIAGAPTAQVVRADVARSLAWEGGQLDFVDEPLASAIERLNRYNRERVLVADEAAGSIPINGVFNAGDTDAFIEAVAQAYPVRVRREGANLVISSTRS